MKAPAWLAMLSRSVLLISIHMLVSGSHAEAAPTGSTLDLASVDRFVNAQMEKHRIPSLALAIVQHDRIVHVRGYGTARNGEPVTGRTQFRLASLSKSFTALAVLKIVDTGQIDLDAPVSRYLPESALTSQAVAVDFTVRQLLNQTSGLADIGFVDGLSREQKSLADRIAKL